MDVISFWKYLQDNNNNNNNNNNNDDDNDNDNDDDNENENNNAFKNYKYLRRNRPKYWRKCPGGEPVKKLMNSFNEHQKTNWFGLIRIMLHIILSLVQ